MTIETAPAGLPSVLDPERLSAVDRTGLPEAGADDILDRYARLAATLVEAPLAFVSLVQGDRQLFPGAVRVDEPANDGRSEPIGDSLCQYAVATEEPLVVPDARRDPLVRGMRPVVEGRLGAYAGYPLRTRAGHVLGTLCVADRGPRQWTKEQLSLLDDLSTLVRHEIDLRDSGRRLAQIEEAGREVAGKLGALVDVATTLVDLAERGDDARLQRAAALTRSRIERADASARALRDATEAAGAGRVTRASTVDLRRPVQRAVHGARAATRTTALDVELPSVPLVVIGDPHQLERAVSHIIVSALHHGGADAGVRVALASAVAEGPGAELFISAPHSRVPAGELSRAVARFHDAIATTGAGRSRTAAIRMAAGGVTADSGPVSARSSANGTTVRARWVLEGNTTAGDDAEKTIWLR
ncbi:MAG: GAF domain-containing protein [Actinomycetota bacterium]|nr:GAF domain-containing protein [Actinomycetota bacterium]